MERLLKNGKKQAWALMVRQRNEGETAEAAEGAENFLGFYSPRSWRSPRLNFPV